MKQQKLIRKRAGRAQGSTKKKKFLKIKKEKDLKYKIVCRYVHETTYNTNPVIIDISKKDLFESIVLDECTKNKMPSTFSFPYSTCLSRIRRMSYRADGYFCPLILWEDRFVECFLCMSHMKRPLNVSDGLRFINDAIAGTIMQQWLKEWKIKHHIFYKDDDDFGKVGSNYWRGFMRRNNYRLRSKVGRRFAVDRSNFTSYLNFRDMYDHVEYVMVNESKVANKLDEPVWMNEKGYIGEEESEAYGLKVTIDLHRPDMCIVMDEVGCNLTQEKDGAKGGQRFLCGADQEAYQSSATKNCHFTVLGLTTLAGEGLMCVVIIQGKKRDIMCETGIDWERLCREDISNVDIHEDEEDKFFEANFGEDKIFPGGPSCYHKGIKIPAYITFNEHGGMDGEILTEIFKRLDNLKVYETDRKKGLTPFVLVDGHQSRFDLEFLEYINNPLHKWNVCLGVPYGTSLWQVRVRV